tara:strand:+ start:867 stop:1469 length:603 start_codon:yes stop_codon:yes gene_type:complete
MVSSVLALDIDGTLDTADPKALSRLRMAAKKYDTDMQINTARPSAYCNSPDPVSTRMVKDISKHHCLVHPNPPTSKVQNMKKIKETADVPKKCVILIDDRPENNKAVRRNGFSTIDVNAKTGIRNKTVNKAIRKMRECALPNVRMRGTRSNAPIKLAVAVTILITIIVVIFGLTKRMSLSKIAAFVVGFLLLNFSLCSLL